MIDVGFIFRDIFLHIIMSDSWG